MPNRVVSMPININSNRSRSALLRGVHITEFKGHVINPDPIILQETDLLLEEFLSPTKLVTIFFNLCKNECFSILFSVYRKH
jgi:hypothetical protein